MPSNGRFSDAGSIEQEYLYYLQEANAATGGDPSLYFAILPPREYVARRRSGVDSVDGILASTRARMAMANDPAQMVVEREPSPHAGDSKMQHIYDILMGIKR